MSWTRGIPETSTTTWPAASPETIAPATAAAGASLPCASQQSVTAARAPSRRATEGGTKARPSVVAIAIPPPIDVAPRRTTSRAFTTPRLLARVSDPVVVRVRLRRVADPGAVVANVAHPVGRGYGGNVDGP